MRRALKLATLVPIALLAPCRALAGDLLDTRITFVLGDDDVLHDAGKTTPNSPRASFGVREGRLFFLDNHNRKDSGQETLTHLVAYKSADGFLPGVTTEAALVLRLDLGRGTFGEDGAFRDDGTYVNLVHAPSDAPKDRLQVTLFPFSTDRFQLGYSYRMAWGSSRLFGQQRRGPAPGLKVSKDWDLGEDAGASWFLGAKTAQIQRLEPEDEPEANDELDAFYAVLGGGGYDTGRLRADLGAGWFQRGSNPRKEVRGEPVDAIGASVQLAFHDGLKVTKSADFGLYRNDPTRIPSGGRAAPQEGWLLMGEFTYLVQSLEDPTRVGGTRMQDAKAGDINLVMRSGPWEPYADLVFRDVQFVLFNVPSFVPYQDLNDALRIVPELWAGVGFNYHMDGLHLTPGFVVGVQRPAAVEAVVEAGMFPADAHAGKKTVVVKQEGGLVILPDGEDVLPTVVGRGQLRWDVSEVVSVISEVFVGYDPNRAEYEDDTAGIPIRVFEDPLLAGFSMLAQARF